MRGSERNRRGYICYGERGNLPLITVLLEVRHRQGWAVYIYDYDEVRSCACNVYMCIYIYNIYMVYNTPPTSYLKYKSKGVEITLSFERAVVCNTLIHQGL